MKTHLVSKMSAAALLATTLASTGALAQVDPDEEAPLDEPEEAPPSEPAEDVTDPEVDLAETADDDEADASASAEVKLDLESEGTDERPVEAVEPVSVAEVAPPPAERKTLWQGLTSDNNRFGIDGTMQMDVAYADYRFDNGTLAPEKLHDFRGQIWLSPVFEHRFGAQQEAFIRGQVDFVAWLRDQEGQYAVNVFDAFAAVGVNDIADLSVGRVTTWRIVQPGNGFDIFTVEDTGAELTPNYDAKNFAAFRYEFDHLWLRNEVGRAVLRVHPLKKFVPKEWNALGLEGTIAYGKKGLSNHLGNRLSGIYDHKFFRVAAGLEELRTSRSWGEFDAPGELCEDCYKTTTKGKGLNVTIRPPYLEAAFNAAKTDSENLGSNGAGEAAGLEDKQTQGYYVELHTGHLLASTKGGPRPAWYADQRGAWHDDPWTGEDIRRLRIGYGMKRTEWTRGNGNFQQHDQHAAYLKYNLGFNQAHIKLVGSYAEAQFFNRISADGEPEVYDRDIVDMLAIRTRFAYSW